MASWQHLHSECRLLPVAPHAKMLSSQFLASSLRRSHPSHDVINMPSGPRFMKHTVKSAFLGEVQPFLNGDTMHQEQYSAAKRGIHTVFVQRCIAEMGTSPVLNAPRLPVDASEQVLPCKVRSTLSQLRSGHCIAPNNYKHT